MFLFHINMASLHSTEKMWSPLKNFVQNESVVCGLDINIAGIGCSNLFLY